MIADDARSMPFLGLTIDYDERVLAPRSWTGMQSRWATDLLASAPSGPVLELCAGVGHIGLAAVAPTPRRLVCVDVSPVACRFARANAERAGLADRVEVREARLQTALRPSEQFGLVIADPPWVRSDQTTRFPADPTLAIDGGVDGLSLAHACVEASTGHLAAQASLLLQVGDDDQADAVVDLARRDGWIDHSRRTGEGGVVVRLLHP